MPTALVNSLQTKYIKYLDREGVKDMTAQDKAIFRAALDEVMPRIYMMGFWRDMMVTLTDQPVETGYFTLAADVVSTGVGYDSILAAVIGGTARTDGYDGYGAAVEEPSTVDKTPAVIYSMWHDYSLFGEPASSPPTSNMDGVFDDGYDANGLRRYRIAPVSSSLVATFLMRRKYVPIAGETEDFPVFVPNDASVIKHGFLGKLAEDNADIQRAEYHWQTAQKLLGPDLDSYMGGARPNTHIDPRPERYTAPAQ